MDRRKDEQIDTWMDDEWTDDDICMNRWIDRWMARWMGVGFYKGFNTNQS